MARAGLRKVQRYSLEFQLTAVRLTKEPGIQVQAVAHALDIHPFMLSKWRKDVRDGRLRGPAITPGATVRGVPGGSKTNASVRALRGSSPSTTVATAARAFTTCCEPRAGGSAAVAWRG